MKRTQVSEHKLEPEIIPSFSLINIAHEGSREILPRSQLSLKCMDEADYVLTSTKIFKGKSVRFARQDEGSKTRKNTRPLN